MMLRVLIVGGYGIFGGRIVDLLKDEPRLELIVAGPSLERATASSAAPAGCPASRVSWSAFRRPVRTSRCAYFAQDDDGETWTRTFDGGSFSSRQFSGSGRWERLLCERFGPLTFAMALVPEGGRLHLLLRGWAAFGVPMPMWLCPRSASWEEGDERFGFHVEISHPLTGLIVRYRGWLEPR